MRTLSIFLGGVTFWLFLTAFPSFKASALSDENEYIKVCEYKYQEGIEPVVDYYEAFVETNIACPRPPLHLGTANGETHPFEYVKTISGIEIYIGQTENLKNCKVTANTRLEYKSSSGNVLY